MQGGGNDFSDPSMTETLVETYMEDWISLVYATKPSVKIIVTGPPQWYPNYATALQNYVNQLKAAGKPIRFVPYDGLVDTVDGTHPSLAGYVAWGDALATKVRELYP
jgi:lysophospholipase L1-like esterase